LLVQGSPATKEVAASSTAPGSCRWLSSAEPSGAGVARQPIAVNVMGQNHRATSLCMPTIIVPHLSLFASTYAVDHSLSPIATERAKN
jgi:hypothetical protein